MQLITDQMDIATRGTNDLLHIYEEQFSSLKGDLLDEDERREVSMSLRHIEAELVRRTGPLF